MAWYNFSKRGEDRINEELKQFHGKGEKSLTPAKVKKTSGEGFEDLELIQGFGNIGLGSFNAFYQKYIDRVYENELIRIGEYRAMANMSEIADIIEDATNESTQEDEEGESLKINIKDNDLKQNENIVNNIEEEFYKLFYKNIDINDKLWDIFRTYYIDGRVFYERIIDTAHPKEGIINIKKLPTLSMDYYVDPVTGKILKYFQYISDRPRRPKTIQEAEIAKDIIVFDPNQISFVNYGVYGNNRYEILGYLDKARVPYNQLKLLETSVIIYRIVRAPERFVFRIDTGAMPMDKAMKFVEKVKAKMMKKQSFDTTTGRLSQEPDVLSILENFYLPQCLRTTTQIDLLDGRTLCLKDIIKEYEEGEKNEVYSVDQETGEIIGGEIEWAGITRKNAELVRVWLDNGEHMDCTPDHKFVVWTDETKTKMMEVEAQNLTEEMDLVEI